MTGAETILSSFEYTLNKAGHRLSVIEADGRMVNYTYDDLYRLTEENINGGERVISYTYDNVGNRLSRTDSDEGVTAYIYDDNDRLQTEILTQNGETVHTITYDYDNNGNLTSRTQVTDGVTETTTYTWNDDNRLVKVEMPDGTLITYEYDDEGIRVSTTVDGVTTTYLVDKNRPYAQVLEEFTSEQLQAFYVYGHDLISQTRNTEQDFYLVDGLGSTRGLTDELGAVTDTSDYDAFGNVIESSGESDNSYQFAGEQFDENLDDYYLRQRFYDTNTGRFTRRDTYEGQITEPLTLHKYLYAHSNPVSGTDPSGLYTTVETSAANSIRNFLTEVYIDGTSKFINSLLSGEDPASETLTDIGFSLILPVVGMVAPSFFGGAKKIKKLLETWGEPSSDMLRANMKAAGRVAPNFPNAAHHIVPGTANNIDAKSARTHLAKLGISANDADNGVFLEFRRTGKSQVGSGPIHNVIHTDTYYSEVRRRVLRSKTKHEARQVLKKIARDLETNRFPY